MFHFQIKASDRETFQYRGCFNQILFVQRISSNCSNCIHHNHINITANKLDFQTIR